jgi:methylglutaconyl-CoA hydratase
MPVPVENKAVLSTNEGSITRITLNRPDKRNALNDEVIAGITEALRETDSDERTRAIVISGSGKDFCSGADLSALERISEASVDENMVDAQSLVELFLLIRKVRVPVVAAVRGRALAGGCGLASACDIVLASNSARFGYPEVKIGFVPAIVMAILRRSVSEKLAFELVTRGEEMGAEEAKLMGLVNRVFKDEMFEEEVTAYVQRFENTSKSAVSLTKSLLYQIDGLAFLEALEAGADVNVIARMSDDCRQGIARFLQKH